MEAEHFCSIVAVSIPFLLFEILIVEKVRVSFCDISEIHICYALSQRTKGKDSTKWLVVSPWLQTDYCLIWKFTNFFFKMAYWLSTTRLNGCLGSGHHCIIWLCSLSAMLEKVIAFCIVIVHWGFYVQCVLVVIRNTFGRGGKVSSQQVVITLELFLKRKHIFRASSVTRSTGCLCCLWVKQRL